MVINTNVHAQAAANNLQNSSAQLSRSLARLSSGTKIVNPADDAAGLAVSSRLDAQIKRIDGARSNVGNAISFTQTQDGYLTKVSKALDRMSELSLLAQDATKADSDRDLYQSEFTQLANFINDTTSKSFNGVSLFSANSLEITLDSEGTKFDMGGINLGSATYTAATGSDISTTTGAVTALTNVKSAINELASDRATIGAYQARLNFTVEQLVISKQNITAANSRIRDVDVADEATEFARYNILVQSGTAMVAQANQMPQNVLRLLQ